MQVKKYEASTVIEALQQVKRDLGPDAIILSTQEVKKSVTGTKKYVVVAAVSEHHLRKKEIAQQKLGRLFEDKVQVQSATRQKQFIESVYSGLERKQQQQGRTPTRTPYIDIDDGQGVTEERQVPPPMQTSSEISGVTRVKQAARDAFKTSLNSELFSNSKVQLPVVVEAPRKPSTPSAIALIIDKLKACGVDPELCHQKAQLAIRELGPEAERKAIVDSWFAKWILNEVQVVGKEGDKPVEIFVGPHGSGKTSALVKLAAHYVVNEQKKAAIVTCDLNKVGAVEQLRVYSRILNVPIHVVRNPSELEQKINELEDYDKIFVDTPGISLSNIDELDFMRSIAHIQAYKAHQVHLVVSALTKLNDLGGLLKRFRVSNFNDVVVTNIDQTSQHGILVNIQEKIAKPFHSFGIGSDVVEGFEFASRERVLDLIFKLTKRSGERGNDNRI